MNANPQAIAAISTITISREYGSGGGEIAARIAYRLGWQLIDHAIIERTARELEVHETEIEKHDNAVDFFCLSLEGKASRLNVPVEQSGPAADLSLYPARSDDFRMPGQPSSERKEEHR